jgi:hypothetical protein
MSKSGAKKKNLEFEKEADKREKNLITQITLLKKENQSLIKESKILKELILDNAKKNYQKTMDQALLLDPPVRNLNIKKIFYFQIILGILVIVLSLGFHILYLSVTDCLLFNNGDLGCWIKNWLGLNIHASFYLDILLYSLITLQILLIILIIRNQLAEKY